MKHAGSGLVAVLLAATVSFAQTNILSLNTAIELALKNDVRLLPGKIALQIAQGRQAASTVWQDPEARFETGLNADENFLDYALRFYLPSPWQARAVSMENASLTSAAEAEYQMAGVSTAAEVFRMYREFQCLEKEMEMATRLVEIKAQQASLAEQQVEASMKKSSQALLLRWELREAERELRTLGQKKARLTHQLAERTGLAPETFKLPPLDLSEQFRSEAPDEAIGSAIKQRPELHLLRAQVQQAEAQLKQAQAEQIPWVNHLQTSYSDRSDEWSAQVAVSIPIFSLAGSKKNIARAERSLRQTVVDVSEEAVSAQVRDALDAFDGAADEWRAHRAEQAELENATREEIEKLKEFSPSEPGEWLALEERLIQAEKGLLQTLRSAYSAQADLLPVTGQTRLIEE